MPRISAENASKGGEATKPKTDNKPKVESSYYQATLNTFVFTGNTNWAGAAGVYLDIQVPGLERSQRLYFDSVYDEDFNILPAVEAKRDEMIANGKNGEKWFEIQCRVWNRIAEAMDPSIFPLEEGQSIAEYIRENGFDPEEFVGQGIGVGFLGYLDVPQEHRELAAQTKVLFPTFPGEFNDYNNTFRPTLDRTLVAYDSVESRNTAGKVPPDERMQVIEARTQTTAATPSGSTRQAPPVKPKRKLPPARKTA